MKLRSVFVTGCLALGAASATSLAQESRVWQVEGSRKAPPYRLVLPDVGEGVSYIFDCSGSDLLVTQTGVTELLDMKAGNNARAPDTGEGRIFPEGSALMAVATDRGQPDFTLGTAKPNPTKGWDITIQLPRKDKSFQDFGRAEFVTLFTTGFTALVELGAADRKAVSNFVKECRK